MTVGTWQPKVQTLAQADVVVVGAVAAVQRQTGWPILTHTEADAKGSWDQIQTLEKYGPVLGNATLSHLDKNPDPGLGWLVTCFAVGLELARLRPRQIDRCFIRNALNAFCFQRSAQPSLD